MADRNHSRRVPPAPAKEAHTPQRRDPSPSLPHVGTGAFPLELIDLSRHPDGTLLQMIVEATNLSDALEASRSRKRGGFATTAVRLAPLMVPLHERIVTTQPRTADGWHAKALYALGRDAADYSTQTSGHLHGIAYAVIADALRLAVVS